MKAIYTGATPQMPERYTGVVITSWQGGFFAYLNGKCIGSADTRIDAEQIVRTHLTETDETE